MVQAQTPTFCRTCRVKTMPSRGGFMVGMLVLLLILGIIPGIIYLIYYYMKDLKCPKCGRRDWGSEDEGDVLKKADKMRRAIMDEDLGYKAGDYICNDCLAKKEFCKCGGQAGYKELTEEQARRLNDIARE